MARRNRTANWVTSGGNPDDMGFSLASSTMPSPKSYSDDGFSMWHSDYRDVLLGQEVCNTSGDAPSDAGDPPKPPEIFVDKTYVKDPIIERTKATKKLKDDLEGALGWAKHFGKDKNPSPIPDTIALLDALLGLFAAFFGKQPARGSFALLQDPGISNDPYDLSTDIHSMRILRNSL